MTPPGKNDYTSQAKMTPPIDLRLGFVRRLCVCIVVRTSDRVVSRRIKQCLPHKTCPRNSAETAWQHSCRKLSAA